MVGLGKKITLRHFFVYAASDEHAYGLRELDHRSLAGPLIKLCLMNFILNLSSRMHNT